MFDVGQWQTPTRWRPRRRDLVVVEMDAVGEPDALVQPAALLEIVDRPAVEVRQAIVVLVARLGEMGVQPAVDASRRGAARLDHQPLRHGEGRAGRERHLQHRALGRRRGSGRARARSRRGSCRRPARRVRAACRRPSPMRFIEPRVSVMRMPMARRLLGLDVHRRLRGPAGRDTGGPRRRCSRTAAARSAPAAWRGGRRPASRSPPRSG